ncbi:glyoxylase I family protein [Pseudarcicella hirudinis]|uniref:Glyoxylase I family protein n=1 Tax=Pseudarcicella hirudinis TaxID=1079859 RepID=A0A1I5Z1U1_9BACT|nr:VOC family protein [Pseudarcicella hirudinis]SFQ50463.1 glyoxylase I family protein [Pseudarcicella hirudinis]
MLAINRIHHVAVIVSDYEKSKHFYTEIMGFQIIQEIYRSERESYKLDLSVNGLYQIELFSFPKPPARVSRPEACGLRHLAFEVNDVEQVREQLLTKNIVCEAIRIDEYSGKKFFFIADPDDLPVEFYEI